MGYFFLINYLFYKSVEFFNILNYRLFFLFFYFLNENRF